MSTSNQSETPNEIIEHDKNIYSLSEINKSASVVGSKNMSGDILFPSNITHNSQEYVIRSILKEAFDESRLIKVIRFAPDSQLLIIEKRAFNNSRIERISIPSHVTRIEENAFSDCSKLQIVEIPKDSELQIIGDSAFSQSAIERIYLPIHLLKIGEKAFYQCTKLQTVEIAKNSTITEIGELAFSNTKIESFEIPPHLTKIFTGTFSYTSELKSIEFPTDSEIDTISVGSFDRSSIEKFTIPPKVTEIGFNSFQYCSKLRKFEIPKNSNLKKINGRSSYLNRFESLWLPSSVFELSEGWCYEMPNLNDVKIDADNKRYKLINDNKFVVGKSVENSDFDELVFCVRKGVKNVVIPSNIKNIQKYAFKDSSIETLSISPHLTKISEAAFSNCKKLKRVLIPQNSELCELGHKAFACTKIMSFIVPPQVCGINDAFFDCKKLQFVEISENSKMKALFVDSFDFCDNVILFIPCKLVEIITDKNFLHSPLLEWPKRAKS